MGGINKNSYVSWPVTGGVAIGQITKLIDKEFAFNGETVKASKEDPAAEVVLPSDQTVFIESSRLSEISEDEYKSHLSGLAELFTKKAGGNTNMSKELEVAQAELKTATETIATLTAAKTALEASVNDLTAKNTALATEVDTVKASLSKIEKANLAKDRFAQLKSVDGVAAIDADETKALAKLGEMTEDGFNTILSLAKMYDAKIKASKPEAPVTPESTKSDNATINAGLETAKPDAPSGDTIVAGAAGATGDNPLILAFQKKYGLAKTE